MSEEIPDTADKAIRAWLAAIGFTLVLAGGDMMAEKDGSRFGIGLALVIAALPVHLTWVFWQKAKTWLTAGQIRDIGAIAVSPKWWFGAVLVLVWVLVTMPIVSAPRWPSWPFSKAELATLPTTLKLQFNALGMKPEEISANNIHWAVASYDEQRKETPDRKYVCDTEPPPNYGLGTSSLIIGGQGQPNCAYRDIPSYHEVINTILFLTFDRPISAKDVKLNAHHGAQLPKWDKDTLNSGLATIYFHGDMANLILDVEVVN
jgi:hypothetical protein